MSGGTVRRLGPDLGVLAALGVVATVLGAVTPLSPLVLAIGSGILVAGASDLPDAVVTGVLFVEGVGWGVGLERKTRSLLAAGASICGVSAVLAVGGSIDGDGAAVTYAAGTVLLFDAVTLVTFPIVGPLLGLPDRVFGVWAGLSLFSTGPTAAAGFAISETAGRWATVTKLARNAFIGVLAVGYAVYYTAGDGRTDPMEIWYRFPKFLVGFLAVALLASAGLLDAAARESIGIVSDWLFTLAFVGLGFALDPRQLRTTGLRPIGVVLLNFLVVTGLAYLAVIVLV